VRKITKILPGPYVDDLELGNKPSIDPERGKLYLLIDKIAQLLDEKEGNNASS
jgi:hypothetical protein